MACRKILRQLFQTKPISSAGDSETKLARVLSSLDLTLLGIGSTLGVGIYVLAGKVAKESAGPAVIISFLIAAVASAFAGFCYAEFGARVPKAGSAYSYCYYTVGEFIAFLIGWNLVLEYIIGSASVTKAFSTYLDELTGHKISEPLKIVFPMHSEFLGEYPDFLAFGVVVFFSICLSFGFKGSSNFNSACTGINLCVVVFVIIAGAINAKPENWAIRKEDIPPEFNGGEGGFAPFGIAGIIRGAATCFYGFIGFDCIATTGEEAKTPKKSIPIAITSSLLVIFLTYFGVSAVLTLMWPYYSQNVNAPLTSVFEWIGWTAAKWVVSIGALFGLIPSLLGSLIPLPRIIYAMAGDGLLFKSLGKVSETHHSPVIGTISSGLFTGVMAMIFNLSQLIDMMSIGTLLAYTIVAACVLLLRYRKSDEDDAIDEDKDLKFKQKLWMHLFNVKRFKCPSQFSFRLVAIAVVSYCITIFAVMSSIVFLPNDLIKEARGIALLSVLTLLALGSLVLIALQPKTKKKLYFAVPFVPLVPALSIACNTYLILMLDVFTWIRFGVWILVGIVIYFTYAINHSKLVSSGNKEITLSSLNDNIKKGMKLWCLKCQRKQSDTDSSARIYKFFDLLAVGVGSSLGVGISVLIGGLIKNVTGPGFVVSVALAGLAALVAGLCFAELGIRFLKVNSPYTYSYISSSENFAFLLGWVLILQYVAGTASAAKAIITFIDALADSKITEFLKKFVSTGFQDVFPYFDFPSLIIISAVVVLYAVGKEDSIIVKKIFTIFSVIFIVSIIIIGGLKADIKNWEIEETPGEEPGDGFAPFGVIGIVKGAAIGLYGFIGFDEIGVSAREIKNRKRNLPLVILATVVITLLAYGGIGAVLSLLVPYSTLNLYAAVPFAFEDIGWTGFKWVAAVATFFGFQTSLFGALYSFPRIIQEMANDGLLFHCLGNSHSSSKIPVAGALTGGLVTAAAAGIFPFQILVNLTVMGALTVYTALAIGVTLFRYSPKFEGDEKLSESWMNLINNDPDVSVKAVMQNYFNFKEKQPTNLTKLIITGNIILFGLSSVGIGIIFIYFYEALIIYSLAAIIPAGVLLCTMAFNLISMICQPKCREIIPFGVPLIPLVPCLSIFLNIFLMLTFESLAWILFSIWLAVGLIPHFSWRFLKYLRGERAENSLYEINRTNTLKLNESIWKIKKDKKSFYEGAVNAGFSDNLDITFDDSPVVEVKKNNEKMALQLKQAEIIQTAEVVPEERVEPFEDESEFNFLRVNIKEIDNEVQEDEKVHWECVAEIHTKEDFPQEIAALEIVDNTYNFLTEVSEELLKNEEKFKETESIKESETGENNDSPASESTISKLSETLPEKHGKKEYLLEGEQFIEIKLQKNNTKIEESQFTNEYSGETTDLNKTVFEESLNNKLKESSEVPEETKSSLDVVSKTQTFGTGVEKTDPKEPKPLSDEQNKIKVFKDKLNNLLKSQINNTTSARNSVEVKPVENNQVKNEDFKSSVKTLSKSQISKKLEVLLSEGPRKRPGLSNSFNIKLKETNTEREPDKADEEAIDSQNFTILDSGQNSSTLQDSIKQKILSLRSAANSRNADISV